MGETRWGTCRCLCILNQEGNVYIKVVPTTKVIAISDEVVERVKTSKREWGLDQLTIAYDLALDSMRVWDLYNSNIIKESQPATFSEPGRVLIRLNGELHFAAINSMPLLDHVS